MHEKHSRAVFVLFVVSFMAAIAFIAITGLVLAPLYLQKEAVKYPGDYAPLYLYDHSPYDRIVIEVHYEQNARPSVYALEHLQSVLHKYTGKPVDLYEFGDISPDLVPEATDAGNISSFGYRFLDNTSHCHTGWLGGNMTIYILYIAGPEPAAALDGSGAVAGISYRADSFVVFDNYLATEGIERTVLVHEAGHLLGLEHDDDQDCAMIGKLMENRSVLQGRVLTPDDYCGDHQKELKYTRHNLI